MRNFLNALRKVYDRLSFVMITFSMFILFSVLDYVLLTKTTTWERFLTENSPAFVFMALFLGFINNILISLAITFLTYVIEMRKKTGKASASNSIIGIFLSLVSVGCAVCGGFLLPILGIAASLTAFPFLGLEIKLFSIILLTVSLIDLSLKISGNFDKQKSGISRYAYAFGFLFLGAVYLIPRLPYQFKSYFKHANNTSTASNKGVENVFNDINPEKGYEINMSYGALGPEMVRLGVLDLDKFKSNYERSGSSLTQEQLDILTKETNKKIKIDRENSYFLLDFFWAVGLGNKTRILTEGDMAKYGANQIGGFASTGGWSLGQGDAMNYYAKGNLIPMTKEQENLVEKVASNIYRPCCNNSTAFPDCNHGMALLGALELMASSGATENQMYEASKYFNAFWFPGNYYDIALYFRNKEGKSFAQLPGQVILGKNYSSATGWQSVKQWLASKGLIQQPPKQGGGCGV